MIERIQNWDKNSYPPKASEVVEHDEFKALPPAGKIDTLNKLQAQWADVSSVDNKEDYPGIMRDMETWFGDQRKAIVKDGLAEDLAAGKLTQQQVQAYVTQGPDALDDAGKQHFMGRYGDPQALIGPWRTTKLPITGADGKAAGFAYIRTRPGVTGSAINSRVSDPTRTETSKYSGTEDDPTDLAEVSYQFNTSDGKPITGVEQVRFGEEFARSRRIKDLAKQEEARQEYSEFPSPPVDTSEADALDSAPDNDQPAVAALSAFSRVAQKNPEISKHIGQGLLAGLPGEALKGLLDTSSAFYHAGAFFGDKQAARDYQAETERIERDIEGQSRAGFEGGMVNNAIKSASRESLTMLMSGGAGGQIAKRLGVAAIKSGLKREIVSRAINAVAFLPSSMRSGLDNMNTTLDAADELRRQGKTEEANAVEDNAVMNGWFGTLMETASENMWLNEWMATKSGRLWGDVVQDTLKRKLGPKMGKVAGFMAELLNGANQEGIEGIVSGIGNATWMNAFANQHKDVFGDVPADYIGGAIMGGVMEGGKKLTGKAAEWYAKATAKNVPENPEAASTLAEIRAKAEEIAANPKPEVATPETPAEPISSAPPPAPGADATLQTSPEPSVPVAPAGPEPSPGLSIAPGADSAPVETPKAFAPIAPLPESKSADEVAKVLHEARADAVDAANEGMKVPGAEITAEAVASIAADEDVNAATGAVTAALLPSESRQLADFAKANSGMPVDQVKRNLINLGFMAKAATNELGFLADAISRSGESVAERANENASREESRLKKAESEKKTPKQLLDDRIAEIEQDISRIESTPIRETRETVDYFGNPITIPIKKERIAESQQKRNAYLAKQRAELSTLQKQRDELPDADEEAPFLDMEAARSGLAGLERKPRRLRRMLRRLKFRNFQLTSPG